MRCRLRALGSALLLQAVLLGADAAAAPLLQDDASPSRAQAGLLEVPRPMKMQATTHRLPDGRTRRPQRTSKPSRLEPWTNRPRPQWSRRPRDLGGTNCGRRRRIRRYRPRPEGSRQSGVAVGPRGKADGASVRPGCRGWHGPETAWAGDPPPRNTWTGVEYSLPSQPAPGQGRQIGGGPNLIEEAIELFKEITGHPVTWLLLPIVAFGGAAALVMQYRPQLEKRWRHRRAAHRRHGSSDPSRGHRHHRHHHHHHGTSAGAQSLPLPARRSEKSSTGRSRGHRSSKPRRTL